MFLMSLAGPASFGHLLLECDMCLPMLWSVAGSLHLDCIEGKLRLSGRVTCPRSGAWKSSLVGN